MAQMHIQDEGAWRPLRPTDLAGSGGGGGGGTGDASAANQVITNDRLGALDEQAAGGDTTPSGINGRLQRIAQRLTSLIDRLPVSLGPKASAGALAVVPATDAVHITGGITANVAGAFNRPANTTAYDVGDLVADSTVAGAVNPISLSIVRVAGGSGIIRRVRLRKSGTSLANAAFRVHLFDSVPTVTNGDNSAFVPSNVAGYLGSADVTMTQAFSDGAWGSSDAGFIDLNVQIDAGTLAYALIEARAAYTPVSAETYTVSLEVLQD